MKPENLINAANTATNATSGSNALKLDSAVNNTSSNITQFPNTSPKEESNIINFPGNNTEPTEEKYTDNIVDFPGNNNESNPEEPNNEEPNHEEPKPGDKVDTGKQLNENGEVEDSSTKKTLKAVGRGAAAYATGGSSIGKDQAIVNSKPVDKTIGVIADTVDKVPGAEEVTKALDEAGLADGVNDALDVVGNAKNGDIKGTIESAKKLGKDTKKAKKFIRKKAIIVIALATIPLLSLLMIFMLLFAPVLGGFIDVVENVTDFVGGAFETAGNFLFGEDEVDTALGIVTEIPDYGALSGSRQKMLSAAASAVAAKIPYKLGSHATGPGIEGIPSAGLDCSAFVEWAIWTGTGTKPGYLTTAEITNRIGKDFIIISKDQLQPGDIGLKRRGGSTDDNYNHTGIYAGNDQWFHASGGSTKKVVRNNYRGFTIYLRYVGVD